MSFYNLLDAPASHRSRLWTHVLTFGEFPKIYYFLPLLYLAHSECNSEARPCCIILRSASFVHRRRSPSHFRYLRSIVYEGTPASSSISINPRPGESPAYKHAAEMLSSQLQAGPHSSVGICKTMNVVGRRQTPLSIQPKVQKRVDCLSYT
jgi:hypothetical protein